MTAINDRLPDPGSRSAQRPAHDAPERTEEPTETWPQGISHRATMRISDVLGALRAEFPAVTTSKLRFLEDQGLIEPRRTPAGYRQYSQADIERLRFVLVEQRDRYVPLKVIKEMLAELDAGTAAHEQPLIPRLVSKDGVATREGMRLTVDDVAASAGVDRDVVAGLVADGLLRPDAHGRLSPQDVPVVNAVSALAELGIQPRNLRALRAAAERQVDLVASALAPMKAHASTGRAGSGGQAEYATRSAELGESLTKIYAAWVRQGVRELQ